MFPLYVQGPFPAAEKNGWSYNPSAQTLSPVAGGRQSGLQPPGKTRITTIGGTGLIAEDSFHVITDVSFRRG